MRKNLLPFVFIFLGIAALSAPIRSNLGWEGVEGIPDQSGPTAADYVQEGLFLMYDGIENAGWGVHDPDATSWIDLVNGITISVNGFNSDCAIMKTVSLTDAALLDALASPNMTVEMFTVCGVSPLSSRISPIMVMPETSYFNVNYYRWGTSVNYTTGFRHLFGKQNNWYIYFPREGDVETIRFTLTRDGTTVKAYYYNGTSLDAYSYLATEPTVSPTELRFWRAGDPEVYFVRIYNRTLSEAEVSYNFLIDKARFGL